MSLANNPPAASIVPLLLFCSIPHEKRARLGLDAVVVLSERPGFIGQLVIGYGSGLSLIYDLHGDRVLALLPWQYGLESATWCGGSGLPIRHAADNPTVCPQQLGTRLLTAHADGSLGVWQIPIFDSVPGADHVDAQILSMKEAPSMPYGEIKRTLIINFCFAPDLYSSPILFSATHLSVYWSRNKLHHVLFVIDPFNLIINM